MPPTGPGVFVQAERKVSDQNVLYSRVTSTHSSCDFFFFT